MKKNFYIKLSEEGIEAFCFGFWGNDCYYYLDIFDQDKKKIGTGQLNIENQGKEVTEDWLYDYNCTDDDEREALAEMLGLEEIKPEWYDEDGMLIIDKADEKCNMPKEIIEKVWKGLEEIEQGNMLDYYCEEFEEMADEDGFVSLDDFIGQHHVMSGYSLKGDCFCRKSDWESIDNLLELEEFFEECGYIDLDVEFTSIVFMGGVTFEYDPHHELFIHEVEECGNYVGEILVSENGTMWKKVDTPSVYYDEEGNEISRPFDYVEAEANKVYSINIDWDPADGYKATFYKGSEQVAYEEVLAAYQKE